MCLILFALDVDPRHRLVLAANRDEFHARQTAGVHRWDDRPILAGRDLTAGGTWLGVSTREPKHGAAGGDTRLAAVTNVRDGVAVPDPDKRSRGRLPVDFLVGDRSAEDAARDLVAHADEYAPVNLVVDDGEQMWWATNHFGPVARRVEPGVHGLSNGRLDERWPKVRAGTAGLSTHVGDDPAALLDMLHDTVTADPASLPHTGIPADQELGLSAVFVDLGDYGTRSSTVVRIGADGHGDLAERRYVPGAPSETSTFTW
ncbi:NRDE family protein [Gordonia sp. NPDC003376]